MVDFKQEAIIITTITTTVAVAAVAVAAVAVVAVAVAAVGKIISLTAVFRTGVGEEVDQGLLLEVSGDRIA